MNESNSSSCPEKENPKSARGVSYRIPEDGRAVLLYIALKEGSSGSIIQTLGMPPVPTDPDRALILMTQIGKALDAVTRLEAKEVGDPSLRVNRLIRRWESYLNMQVAKNRIPEAEWRVNVALWNLSNGGSVDELAEAEERLIQLRDLYYRSKRMTDKLRKGKVYLKLASELHTQLRSVGLKL